MLRKEKDEHVAECDGCGCEEYGGTQEFRDFIATLKSQYGWLVRKCGDTWEHYCEDCAADLED